MKNKDLDNTLRLDEIGSKQINSGDTIRLSDSSGTERTDSTRRVGKNTIIRSGLGGEIEINTGAENLYAFNGKEYLLLNKLSESTAEAQIFLIEKDDKKYILKYYYPFVKPKKDVIEKLRSFSHPDIVSVIDYGYFKERFLKYSHMPIRDHLQSTCL